MKDYTTLYSIKTLLNGYRGEVLYGQTAKVPLWRHMSRVYGKLVEYINDIELIEIAKVSARKWQVTHITTSDNSFNVKDDELFLPPANFDLKVLTEQIDIYLYNSLLGVHLETVSKREYEKMPERFKVYDEDGKEITQDELRIMHIKHVAKSGA
jgi:hypothetical protein